jgi:hypothetical protein
MVIEFYSPDKKVKGWIITLMRDEIMKLHHRYKEISRAEVYFREKKEARTPEMLCEINLSIYKDSIRVTGTGKNFDQAAKKAVSEMKDIIALNFNRNNEPPEEIVNTIQI